MPQVIKRLQNQYRTAREMLASISPENSVSQAKLQIARDLLVKHKLINSKENPTDILQGRIVDAYEAKGSHRFIIVYLDQHDDDSVKRQIVNAIKSLKQKGLQLIGLEGSKTGIRLFLDKSDCDDNSLLSLTLACELSHFIYVVGTEDPSFLNWSVELAKASEKLVRSGDSKDQCRAADKVANLWALAFPRSQSIVLNTNLAMEHFSISIAALPIGGLHFKDLQTLLPQWGISYIGVAVSAFDKNIDRLKNELDGTEKSYREHCDSSSTSIKETSGGCSVTPFGKRP